MSHPIRVRGLKRVTTPLLMTNPPWSHPIRVRGLKQKHWKFKLRRLLSHPIRVRGLKLFGSERGTGKVGVAPHTGAWIETAFAELEKEISFGRTPYGCVD